MIPPLTIGKRQARYAIVQGGMSIKISLSPLAAAVAREGGVGTIGGMMLSKEELRGEIRRARTMADGVIGVNLMYAGAQFDQGLEVCIEEQVDFVAIGAGFGRAPFRKLGKAGIPGIPIISSAKAARIVVRTPGVEAVIVESGTAGGHLGPKNPAISIFELFPEVLAALRGLGFKKPVIAAGGILTHQDIVHLLKMGADGVQLGTRFAAAKESSASAAMKQLWFEAKASRVCWWSPTGYASRAIFPYSEEKLPKVDGKDVVCSSCLKKCRHRDSGFTESHCIRRALLCAQSGDIENGLVFSGSRVGEINEPESVSEIFKDLLGRG